MQAKLRGPMNRFIIFSLLFFNFLFASQQPKDVLLLHSYHKGYIWSDDISKEIEKNFAEYKNIELTTVYMDTKRVADPIYLNNLAKLYKQQFESRNFDLIIVSDNNAFEFAIRYHEYLFKDLPVLFCGINNFDKAQLDENYMTRYMTGVVEQVDTEKNFELISKLHPELKNLIIINDQSKTSLALKRDLRPVIEKYKNKFNIEYIDDIRIEDLKEKVKKLNPKTDVILYGLLFKDTTGKYFTYKQSFKQIREVSPVPIYGLWDFYLNYGIVGGLLTSAIAQGNAVSKMALDILLKNKEISDIPIVEKSPNLYMFDYNELKRFNLEPQTFLNNLTIVNEPINVYKEHSKFFIIAITIILILSIIVLTLRANIQRRIKLEQELSNRLEFDKVLLDTIPNPIYYKNTEGKFLGCNIAFASLVNSTRNEVIGKTAFDFFPNEIASKNTKIDKELLKTFSTSTSEFTFYTPLNEMKHIILNKAVYKNIDGTIGGIVCIMDDITERVQQKQFLIQQSKLAEMGDMVAAIAHQWNEPLVELSALVQDIQTSYLLNELKDIDVNDFVKDSMVQIQYMSKTLSDFRNFLKPSTKKKLFSISKSLNEINEIIGKQVFYSNIKMNFNYKNKDEELLIYGYENEFKQVLLNLINNAKNKIVEKNLNTHKKGTININIQRCINYNTIEICDDAGAIEDNILSSIFEPYFTTKENGTGLGLYMAKVIIEDKMRGTISARNNENQAIFTIKLPHKKV
jgi:PAS domain S-box-containing protein